MEICVNLPEAVWRRFARLFRLLRRDRHRLPMESSERPVKESQAFHWVLDSANGYRGEVSVIGVMSMLMTLSRRWSV